MQPASSGWKQFEFHPLFSFPMRLFFAFVFWRVPVLSAKNDLLRHYNAAQAFSEKGDQTQRRQSRVQTLSRRDSAPAGQCRSRNCSTSTPAEKLYEEASGFSPNDPALSVGSRARALLKQGKISEARPLAEKPWRWKRIRYNQLLLGRILFKQGNYAAAKPHLEAAIVADPNPIPDMFLASLI